MKSVGHERAPREVWILVCSGSAPLDVTGPFDVLRRARDDSGAPVYRVALVGARTREVTTDSGLGLGCHLTLSEVADRPLPHTIIVGGGDPRVAEGSDEACFATWLSTKKGRIPRITSVCTGAFVLAQAGLLDGARATTHWSLLGEFGRRFPEVVVVDDTLFVFGAGVWTSAGVTSGIDMTLAMVEEDHGHEVSLEIAKFLVLFVRRSGSHQQLSASLDGQRAETRRIRELQAFIVRRLAEDLSVERLAEACHMSPRNLSRVFKAELGFGPGRFVRKVRLDEARRLLEDSDLSIAEIADRVGSGRESTLRRWFAEEYGISPRQYRERLRSRDSTT